MVAPFFCWRKDGEHMFKYLNIGEGFTLGKVLLVSGGLMGFIFGGWHELMGVLLVIQGLDVLTGILVGVKNKGVSSKEMRAGLIRKAGVWILVIFAHMIDITLFEGNMVAQMSILFAFIGQEGLSLTENLGNIGVIVPESVSEYLAQVKNKGESADKSEEE